MRAPLLVILTTIMLETMSVGIILPVMPQLLTSVGAASLADAAIWAGVLTAAFSVSQFLFAPLLGALSDRFGRRPVLLVSLAVMAADFVVMALAETIWLLLIARIVSGIAAATFVTALAYVADITIAEDRARRFGFVSAALGLGLVLGPVIGGTAAMIDDRAPFILAAVLAAINLAVALIALPETLAYGRRRRLDLRRANPFSSLAAISALPGILPLVTVFALMQLATLVYPSVWAFYVEANLGWRVSTIGISLAAYGIWAAFAQALMAPALLARVGEDRTVRIGMALGMVSLLGYGVARSDMSVWVLVPFAGLATISTPALQGLMSRSVPADRQGELQGVLGSVSAAAMIISPLLMTAAFSWGTRPGAGFWFPGAPFTVAAIILALALTVLARWSLPLTTVEEE